MSRLWTIRHGRALRYQWFDMNTRLSRPPIGLLHAPAMRVELDNPAHGTVARPNVALGTYAVLNAPLVATRWSSVASACVVA
jgi:hypothetical protein